MDGQKCAHEPCSCYVDLGKLYCGERCRENDAASPEAAPHSRCGCRHVGCEARD
ncbi:MAG TPA: metallothionein [Verrucomicrobiae bacterium]|nr:metallothionein [Verrucomicrobiae bacterium]